MDIVVEAVGLKKTYGEFVAVDGIDFEIRRGECFGFLGPNGAGKTTTMRMIYRASPLTDGSLVVLGHEARGGQNDRLIKARIGVVPQEDNLDQELTVRENLSLFCGFYGLRGAAASARVDELLAFADLVAKAGQRVETLSGGMKRRLLIARGLLGRPDLVILDEPTTGLDPRARQILWEKLGALRQRKATLVLTTHYMEEAERLCDRIAIMGQGRIVAVDTPAALIENHAARHVVEVRLGVDGLPPHAADLTELGQRAELLTDRLLIYAAEAEPVIAEVLQRLPDHVSLARRGSLEDVYLNLTGKELTD